MRCNQHGSCRAASRRYPYEIAHEGAVRVGAQAVPLRDERRAARLKARSATRALVVAAACMFSSACSASREHANTARLTRGEKVRGALAQLRAREAELRREALGTLRFTQAHVGADPVRLCPLRGGLVGLVQGRSELVMLDAALNEVARTSAPPDPVACAALGDSELVVVGARPRAAACLSTAGSDRCSSSAVRSCGRAATMSRPWCSRT